MLVLIGILLAIVPAVFILWPFVVGLRRDEFDYDEGAPQADSNETLGGRSLRACERGA